ncbi:hypothetical protein BVK86_28695, partial [Pseudomonas reinekei]
GVEIDFFDFCVGTHHEVLAPERNREHSIGDQVAALNVGFMERLPLRPPSWSFPTGLRLEVRETSPTMSEALWTRSTRTRSL